MKNLVATAYRPTTIIINTE